MVSVNESVALSVTALVLISFISISILVCIVLVYWRYRSREKEKTVWYNSPSELRTGWLSDNRKCLVPGTFSAKVIQPDPVQATDTEPVSATDSCV